MRIPSAVLRDTVVVETYLGDGAHGPDYADPVTVRCVIRARRRLVRGADGNVALCETSFDAAAKDAGRFTPESRITVDGHATTVITSSPQHVNGRVSHTVVDCR